MLTLFFAFLSLTATLHAQVPQPPRPEHYELKGEFDYFSTTANFPSGGGSSQALADGNSLVNMTGLAQVSYDFDRQWRVYSGLSYAYSDAKVYNLFTLTQDTQTSTGVNEGWAGVQWWYRYAGFSLVPQGDFVYPFYRVNTNSTDALLGEGALRLQGGSWVMYSVQGFTPFGYLGYAYRDQGRSSLLPYAAGVNYRQRGMWWGQAELRGYTSITSDTNSANGVLRSAFLYQTDGGSMAYYTLNPDHTDFVASGGWQFGGFTVYAAASIAAFGSGSADGWTGTLGVTFGGSFLTPPARQRDHIDMPPEQYDSSLFQENAITPTKTEPPADDQIQIRQEAPPQSKPKKRRPPVDNQPEPNVELIMKDTQKSLEKKQPSQ